MPLTPDALLDFLAARGIPATTYSHPPLHTVAQSKVLRGDIPGAHTRNLFLRDSRKTHFLVTIAEDTPVDLKALRGPLGARGSLSFGSPEALYEQLGVLPGSVTLLAAVNDTAGLVRIAIDAALLRADAICCHPLTNDRTTALSPDALRAFLKLTGHDHLEIDMKIDMGITPDA
ncbi:prolyl-tRNA synthetase associated domain-containing protein [Xanthobacter dioxanivorans]|uniref:Prolyl-tRNA synthetase associated domain-containing protein n=1 Tax=Xanthobacter dioxanivorans TaxID=2528964 RepID=A0A974PQQ1_9HYPH|nr:prolyl-tRNA synthetase associated domain-containing protein [Xanthobacter dioxanivorans]QRG08022.1 prolyl-tRNA synthetase associated domain-containing protein [Xanthobacter dioxanivorans]